ncbi:MAG: agarase [Lentimonas sp.]
MKRLKYTFIGLTLLCGVGTFAGDGVQVDVNLNVRHVVGGVDSFDREKWMVIHARSTEDDWDSEEMRASFLNDYDVYIGRDCGAMPEALSWTSEDPEKPGWCDHESIAGVGKRERDIYGQDTAVHALEYRARKMTIGGQPKMFPDGTINGDGFAIGSFDALADFYEQFLTYYCGTGGTSGNPMPYMLEVVNEPFVHAHEHDTTYEEITEFHNKVAERVRNSHPDVLIGGYTAAHPQYEDHNFGHWDRNWRLFIDEAGENMDFFSVHLYDNPLKNKDFLNSKYRSGSNIEAILDMVEHYSMLKLGEVKPFNISEYGCLRIANGLPYHPDEAWRCVRSYSTILMQLLERTDRILQAIPFMVLKAEWGRKDGFPYPKRLLYDVDELNGKPKDNDGPWVYTPRINFWELWKGVAGTRVDTIASDPDIQVDAYVNGADAYVMVSSLDHTGEQMVDLNLFGAFQDLLHVEVKHSYADENKLPVLDHYTRGSLPSLTLGASATAVLKYSFRAPLVIDQTSTETKYYATSYLQKIEANSVIEFEIPAVNRSSKHGEAVLRLGLGRAHGLSLRPELKVNGRTVAVPTDWRGYDQATRGQFFGVIEIPIPYQLLKQNNQVKLSFPDAGGHVSSLSMQVFEFSQALR